MAALMETDELDEISLGVPGADRMAKVDFEFLARQLERVMTDIAASRTT